MVIFSNCKINIGLDIVNKRADGYHDIVTCMVPVPWHDIIEILPAKGTGSTLTVLGNKVDCPPERNLVMRAYRTMAERYDLPPADIILQKIVPDGAGLGGGSSDATSTIKGLNMLHNLQLSHAEMADIAATLGADCPFFVYDEPMIAEGIGEILRPIHLDLKGYYILIAKPTGVNISTKEAYAGVIPTMPETPLPELLKQPIQQWQGSVKNDFEASIFPKAPEIAELKRYMKYCGAVYASMSGSGASVYGIFDNDKMAEMAKSLVVDLPHFLFRVP